MLYETFQPPPRLAPYVRFFWAMESDVRGEEFVHRSMADGCVEIVFHYRGAFDEITRDGTRIDSPLSNIQAQSTEFRRYATRSSFGIFGAYLYPYAIPRLFAYPASDFTNIAPSLGSALGREGDLLEEQMLCAPGNRERVDLISGFLDRKLSMSRRELPALYRSIGDVLDADGNIRVAELAANYNISLRQFERRFRDLAGLSPKLYSRVVRFQAATQQRVGGFRDLTEIAYSCGYYDQPHFINDFKQFSGYTPKEYFRTAAEGTQYMAA